jgi:hypothetical protein
MDADGLTVKVRVLSLPTPLPPLTKVAVSKVPGGTVGLPIIPNPNVGKTNILRKRCLQQV